MREDDFIGQAFYWFTGEVQKVNDPKKMNRVKVRCHGYHNSEIKDEDLPWATVMMPSTSQSSKGYGRTHELEEGSWVVGFFRDGMSAQDPLVLGSIATQTTSNYPSVMHITEDNPAGDRWTTTTDIPHETEENYPDNKVYKSKGGHLVEFDNTDGKERIHIKHRGGTEAEIDKDNNLTVNVKEGGDLTIIVKEGNTLLTTYGRTDIVTTDDTQISTTGKTGITSGGDIELTSTGGVIIISSTIKTRIM